MPGVKGEAVVVYADPLTTQSRLGGISSALATLGFTASALVHNAGQPAPIANRDL